MAKYFEYFPRTVQSNKQVIDITRRVDFNDTTLGDPYVFLPFTIEDGEKPEDIAFNYYGDVKYTWLVYLSAGIIDPYFDWPMDTRVFDDYIIKKYAAQANTTGTAVIDWTQNTTITTNIVHYYNVNDGTIISKDTFANSTNIVQDDYEALRFYEYEVELNENKRAITLLSKSYVRQAEQELKEILNDGTR